MRSKTAVALIMGAALIMLVANSLWADGGAGDACSLLPQAQISA